MNENVSETWKPAVDFEGLYEVSDLGSVRGLRRLRTQRGGGIMNGRILIPWPNSAGYLLVSLQGGYKRLVSRMVLEAFIGPCPPGMEACHGPLGKQDNALANLRWDSPSANQMDRVRDGTTNRGERSGHTHLSWHDIEKIRERVLSHGEVQRAVAADYGITQSTVSRIVTRDTWR